MTLIEEDIEKLEALLAEVMPGIWTVLNIYPVMWRTNIAYITALCNLAPSLIADWKEMRGEIERLTKERDEAYEALEEIKTWSEAYPLNIFPEPDFKKAHEVLKSNGMTLDSISASSMRHVLNGMIHIVNRALKAKETKQ